MNRRGDFYVIKVQLIRGVVLYKIDIIFDTVDIIYDKFRIIFDKLGPLDFADLSNQHTFAYHSLIR